MRFKSTAAFFRGFAFALLAALSAMGCEYGIFNKDYPDHSEILVYADNDLDNALSKSRTLTYLLDDEKMSEKFIRIEAKHMKGESESKGGFAFESDTVSWTVADEKTIVVPLNRIRTLGVHEIRIISSLGDQFNKKFLICASSSLKSIDVEYSIEKKAEGIEYGGSDKGSFTTQDDFTSPITLIPSSTYAFKLGSESKFKIPTVDFTVKDSGVMHFEKESDCAARLIIESGSESKESSFTISIRNSDIKITVPVLIKDIANLSISEESAKDDKTNVIFIENTDSAKNYAISLKTASDDNRTLVAYFAKQGNSEDISGSITNSLKNTITVQSNDYFSLSFNGKAKTLNIIPKKQTTLDNRNLHFYLYVYDTDDNYFGRWRIMIGGNIEKIELEPTEISAKTQTSSSTRAALTPNSDSRMLIWYLSKSKGDDIAPPPMEKQFQDNIVSFMTKYAASDTIRIGDLTYDTSKHSFGMTQGLDHTMRWTTGSEAACAYLIALDPESLQFDSVPFLVSAESSIVLKSDDPISGKKASDMAYNGNTKEFEDGFHAISFPYGQCYPDTYANGENGRMTRMFYLPHNRISRIGIKTSNIRMLTVSPTSQSNQLLSFELLRSESEGCYDLEITPAWLDLDSKSKSGSTVAKPPCQNPSAGADSYGKIFYQYIGRCSLEMTAYPKSEENCESKIKIKIVLFENT